MSTFGSPGGQKFISKPTPPERGSFPLDHEGECSAQMSAYLKCIKAARGVNQPDCRQLSKEYLSCRMDKNLMAHDEMKNLGFASLSSKDDTNAGAGTSSASKIGEVGERK